MSVKLLIEQLEKITQKKVILKENTEGIPSVLYHFTTPQAYIKILNSNSLDRGKNGYLSFTEDPELWLFKGPDDNDEEIGVRLAFKSQDCNRPEFYVDKGSPFDDPMEYEKEWRSRYRVQQISKKILNVEILAWAVLFLKNHSPDTLTKFNYKVI